MEEDLKKLNKKALWEHITSNEYHDWVYSRRVSLLLNLHDMDKIQDILYYIVQNDKKIITIYPGLGEKVPKGAIFVTSVIDGALYYI